tara:strand:- start:7588 stop:8022 length:435 start_codon:yes stop_codon:yes gene_type:complete
MRKKKKRVRKVPKDKDSGLPKRYLTGLKGSRRTRRANLIKRVASIYKSGGVIPISLLRAKDKSIMAVRRKPLSASVQATLRRKAKASKRYTYGTLAKVYRRGQGAFLSAGSRRVPMAAWSMGRVNSFLRGSRKHDTDLRRKRKK